MPGLGSVPVPKPEPHAKVKRRRQRQEKKVVSAVREQCVERDGDCRIGRSTRLFGACSGVPEWAHLGEKKRFKTRGLPPEIRHTTYGSLILCSGHHDAYDEHRITITPQTDRGADGPMTFVSADTRAQLIEVKRWKGSESRR